MSAQTIVYLSFSLASVVIYAFVAGANLSLSRKLDKINGGDASLLLRLLALLCIIILLGDLFWDFIIVSRFVFGEKVASENYRNALTLVGILIRAVPALLLVYLWSRLIQGTEEK